MKLDHFTTYRDVLAGRADGQSCWWYLGATYVELPGLPVIPVMQAETIMVYRTQTLAPGSLRIHWREIGYFRDPATGETARTWLNPITGHTVAAPASFQEGPSAYTMTDDGSGGVTMALEQAHARVLSVDIAMEAIDGRIHITQTEHKRRGFPLPGGTMPDPDSDLATKTCTVLSLYADLPGAGGAIANSTGLYSFELDTLPAWMGFGDRPGRTVVRGLMRKGGMSERVNPTGWDRLQGLFPAFFDGATIAPKW